MKFEIDGREYIINIFNPDDDVLVVPNSNNDNNSEEEILD